MSVVPRRDEKTRRKVVEALTRPRPNQLFDLLIGGFFLVLFCVWVLEPISGTLAGVVFVLAVVGYLVRLASEERDRRRHERQRAR